MVYYTKKVKVVKLRKCRKTYVLLKKVKLVKQINLLSIPLFSFSHYALACVSVLLCVLLCVLRVLCVLCVCVCVCVCSLPSVSFLLHLHRFLLLLLLLLLFCLLLCAVTTGCSSMLALSLFLLCCVLTLYLFTRPPAHLNGLPVVGRWIPFIGSGVSFAKHGARYLKKVQQQVGDVFVMYMGGKYLTIILNPDVLTTFYKSKEAEMSFFEAVSSSDGPMQIDRVLPSESEPLTKEEELEALGVRVWQFPNKFLF